MDFYFDKVLQPGQAGVIRLTIKTKELIGPLEREIKLYTNDPRNPSIDLKINAVVKPLPDYVARITTAGVAHGQELNGFQVWPTANPVVTVPLGEGFRMSLRIRPLSDGPGDLKLAAGADSVFKLRREKERDVYWLDIDVGPMKESGTQEYSAALKAGDGASPDLPVRVTAQVPSENVVVSAKAVSMKVSLATLKAGSRVSARVGIRKLVGQLQIKSVSSSLAFLNYEAQTIVTGSNYLIRITLDANNLPRPGTYTGVLQVETDDPQKPRIEIPCTVEVVE
ncbi:MAG TPA: hypothetical protein VE262_04725 [Blastocatellia bacterium]|nr:hypothetical protein [Blastocatellia bacterium]